MTINSIYLRRAGKVIAPKESVFEGDYRLNLNQVTTISVNLSQYGYVLAPDLMDSLRRSAISNVDQWYREVRSTIKNMVGTPASKRPMYPNFPQQVMEASDAELYWNAIIHYVGDMVGVRIMPQYKVENRAPLDESVVKHVVRLGSLDDFYSIISNLLDSKSPYSDMDIRDLQEAYDLDPQRFVDSMPAKITVRENMATIFSMINLSAFADAMVGRIDTATDLLRIAVGLSDGDTSLSENPRFKKFSRPMRRFFLGSLDRIPAYKAQEDMDRFSGYWVRLGEVLHPGEYASRFPNAAECFRVVRNNVKVQTFNRSLEAFMASGDYDKAANLLVTRPGEFARHLGWLLKSAHVEDALCYVEMFGSIAHSVPSTTLYQVKAYLTNLLIHNPERMITMPKNGKGVPKVRVRDLTKDSINTKVLNRAISVCSMGIRARFSELGTLSKVWLGPEVKGLTVPIGVRSMSENLRYIGRGSQIDFDANTSTLRFFIHWTDGDSRTDVDLSAVFLDKDFNTVDHVSFTRLRGAGHAFHSGDITSAPDGATEFIDVPLDGLPKDYKYIAMRVYSYSGQSFEHIPECFVGYMSRENPGSGEIYEPSTVKNKVDLTSHATSAMPYIFDVHERKAIWVDLYGTIASDHYSGGYGRSMVENDRTTAPEVLSAIVSSPTPTLEDMFKDHIESRGGQVVLDRGEADLVVSEDGDISPYDCAGLLSKWLV